MKKTLFSLNTKPLFAIVYTRGKGCVREYSLVLIVSFYSPVSIADPPGALTKAPRCARLAERWGTSPGGGYVPKGEPECPRIRPAAEPAEPDPARCDVSKQTHSRGRDDGLRGGAGSVNRGGVGFLRGLLPTWRGPAGQAGRALRGWNFYTKTAKTAKVGRHRSGFFRSRNIFLPNSLSA